MNLARKKRLALWTLHRLEAYATLALRSVKRCLKKHSLGGPQNNGNQADGLM